MNDLKKPAFIIGYTTLLAIVGALFVFTDNTDIVMPIVTVLTNVLTGAVTYYYTKENYDKNNNGIPDDLEQ